MAVPAARQQLEGRGGGLVFPGPNRVPGEGAAGAAWGRAERSPPRRAGMGQGERGGGGPGQLGAAGGPEAGGEPARPDRSGELTRGPPCPLPANPQRGRSQSSP